MASMPIMTPKVILKNKYIPMRMMRILEDVIPPPTVFSKKTFDNCPWARERAHRRRYEAVFEMLPRINSMVSII